MLQCSVSHGYTQLSSVNKVFTNGCQFQLRIQSNHVRANIFYLHKCTERNFCSCKHMESGKAVCAGECLSMQTDQLQGTLCPFWMGAWLPIGSEVKDGLCVGAGRGEVMGCNSYSRYRCFGLCHGCFIKYLLSSLETESELFLVSTPTTKQGSYALPV